jgi:hypothetical protein
MNDKSDAVAEARFMCSACDKEAGQMQLSGKPSLAYLGLDSFVGSLNMLVLRKHFDSVRRAIAKCDARTLYSLDLEYVPFYCPKCRAIYCGRHWKRWDVFDDDDPSWHDSIRGRCPKGHERKLQD